jgi:hypothetical protein
MAQITIRQTQLMLKNGKKGFILEENDWEFCDDLWREIKSYLLLETPLFWNVMDLTTLNLAGGGYPFLQWHLHSGNFNSAKYKNPSKTIVDFSKQKCWKSYLKWWFRSQVQNQFKDEFRRVLKNLTRESAIRRKDCDWKIYRIDARRRTLVLELIKKNLSK